MADGYDLVRRLGMAAVRMDGAYYMCAKKFGVKENMLDLLYALDDGAPHTQKQICGDWLMPKTWSRRAARRCSPRRAGARRLSA